MLLYRGESGKVVALNDRCPHRGALLSRGPARRRRRALHVSRHQVRRLRQVRADSRAGHDSAEAAGAHATRWCERGHFIWVWMGEPAKADPALIVDLPYLHDPQWKGIPAYLHYDANYLLIVDNLSDFSHLAFVHTQTLGRLGGVRVRHASRLSIERLERGFRVERWHLNSDPPPFHQKVIPRQDREGRPPQHRDHVRPRHLHHGDAVRRRRAGRARRATSRAPGNTATASS